MINFDIICNRFDNVQFVDNKLKVSNNLVEVLEYLKNTPEFDFNMLTSIVAVDMKKHVELIYQLFSSKNNNILEVSFDAYASAPSVISVYKSAYFDECEIFDLFGVDFNGNEKLKRLFMPETWVGNPLLKSYEMNDERLAWNEWYYQN